MAVPRGLVFRPDTGRDNGGRSLEVRTRRSARTCSDNQPHVNAFARDRNVGSQGASLLVGALDSKSESVCLFTKSALLPVGSRWQEGRVSVPARAESSERQPGSSKEVLSDSKASTHLAVIGCVMNVCNGNLPFLFHKA